jgi:lysophospholipase L1-like esterase
MKIQPGSKLVFVGDSITDCGRSRPVGEAGGANLGNGYVALVNALLNNFHPGHGIRVVNMGVGGDTVRELKSRWQRDVLDLKPDWLSIMIGINDVWRRFDTPLNWEWQIPLEEYTQTLDELVQATLPHVKGLVLMSPFFVEPNRADVMRALTDRFGEAMRGLAGKTRAYYADTQAAFDAMLRDTHPMGVAVDRVHPTLTGHLLLARTFLQAVGSEGVIE